MKHKIYTLEHPITNEIRYVGYTSEKHIHKRKSTHIYQARHNKSTTYSSNWIKSLLKQNIKPVIKLLDETDSTNWQQLEQYWISQFKTWGFRLTNLTEGGEGNTGYAIPEEKRKHLFKPVLQYDLNGKFIREFKNLKSVGKESNLKTGNGSGIIKAIKNNTAAKGYRWKYKTENYSLDIGKINFKQIKTSIDQYDVEGNFIKKWESVNEAALFYNIWGCNITRSIKNKGTCGGFQWKHSYSDKEIKKINFIPQYTSRPLLLTDFNNNIIKEYISGREAAKDLNISYKLVFAIASGKIKNSRKLNGKTIKYK